MRSKHAFLVITYEKYKSFLLFFIFFLFLFPDQSENAKKWHVEHNTDLESAAQWKHLQQEK